MVHCRLIALRKCIQNKKLEALELQLTYKSLVDFTETVKKSFEPLIRSDLFAMESISIVSLVIVIFAPSIAASSLPTEVDTIKITLHDSVLEENGENN
ncbi:unnamed protein product, partial [Brenthis ino]